MNRRFGKTMLAAILLGLALCAEFAVAQDDDGGNDPADDCAPSTIPIVTENSASFPGIGQKATMISNDTVAKAKWDEISGKVLKLSPKPANGKTSGYSDSDPDCWWTYNGCTTPKNQGVNPDVATVPPPSTMGYGFDDGPYCGHDGFYDFLKAENQTASMFSARPQSILAYFGLRASRVAMFFIGSNVFQWPLQTQRAFAEGHELCIHSWSHPYLTSLSSEDVFAELYYSVCCIRFRMQAIKLIAGVTPTCFRPPYGDIDDRVRSIAGALGLQTIMWAYVTEDADIGLPGITASTVDKAYNDFIGLASNGTFATAGTILLQHELDNFTVSKAMQYYPRMKEVVQHIVPVGVALNKTQPYVETNYTFPTFEQYIAGARVGVPPTATIASPVPAQTSSSGSDDDSDSSNRNLRNAGSAPTTVSALMITMLCSIFSGVAFFSTI
ncbi:hypothetical protein AAF712_014183 [Marasmius tenuissimus]|uniref:chitin deacetylase n=1 Tax=Marasmius tenuissimus TaxID=585030 RepID=A0ABR2ZF87_9AGAR